MLFWNMLRHPNGYHRTRDMSHVIYESNLRHRWLYIYRSQVGGISLLVVAVHHHFWAPLWFTHTCQVSSWSHILIVVFKPRGEIHTINRTQVFSVCCYHLILPKLTPVLQVPHITNLNHLRVSANIVGRSIGTAAHLCQGDHLAGGVLYSRYHGNLAHFLSPRAPCHLHPLWCRWLLLSLWYVESMLRLAFREA